MLMRASIGTGAENASQRAFELRRSVALKKVPAAIKRLPAVEITRAPAAIESVPAATVEGCRLDGDPQLMEQSYRLRYQVYCVERGFLNASDYPEQLERDEFDRYSVHVGVVDHQRLLMASSRLIQISMSGLPLFRHCQIFPDETELYCETNRIVEVSRLCMSRHLRERGHGRAAIVSSLYRTLYQASKRAGFTHWLVATEHSLQRLVTSFGFPFRPVGPLTDYFGPVAPYLMDLREFDQVILSGTRPALSGFLEGLEPEFMPVALAEVAR
jgi:N-acyl-L-homoserine lactone synthetase